MLHTKFRGNRPAGSGEEDFLVVFTIYGRGGHQGPANKLSFPYPWMLHTKFGFHRPSDFREDL